LRLPGGDVKRPIRRQLGDRPWCDAVAWSGPTVSLCEGIESELDRDVKIGSIGAG